MQMVTNIKNNNNNDANKKTMNFFLIKRFCSENTKGAHFNKITCIYREYERFFIFNFVKRDHTNTHICSTALAFASLDVIPFFHSTHILNNICNIIISCFKCIYIVDFSLYDSTRIHTVNAMLFVKIIAKLFTYF
jgi:hypothetical protein